jgi:predicted acyl esterase
VHEIDPNGGSIRLSTDALRARYRESLRVAKPVMTGAPLHYEFERFTFVSRRIRSGHRLRLIIAPYGRLIESTFVQKNFNGGGVVAQETAAHGRRVTVRLFHDEQRPSALYVPVGLPG